MKFVGTLAANCPVVCLHGPKIQTQAGEGPLVSVIHGLISDFQRSMIHMKGIGVFHDEFATTHQPETGSDLVAELGLNLIKIDGKLLVGMNFAPR